MPEVISVITISKSSDRKTITIGVGNELATIDMLKLARFLVGHESFMVLTNEPFDDVEVEVAAE